VARAFLAVVLVLAGACTPTLSQPRGEEHLDAMARAGRHYHHGRMQEAAREYGLAAEHAERRVDRDEARYRQAKSLERAGEPERALGLLDQVAEARPVSRRTGRALFDAAKLRMELGRREEGLAGFRRLVREHPEHGLASRALWLVLEEMGDDAALAYLEQLDGPLGESSLGDDILAHRADILRERGDLVGARRTLERLVERHPYPHGQRWDDALVELADMAEEQGDHRGAVAYLEELVSVHEHTDAPGSYTLPTMPEAQLRIARIHRDHLGNRAAAAAAFREAYDEYPTARTRDDALVELAEMYLESGDVDGACALFAQALEEFDVGRAHRRATDHHARHCQ